MNESILLQQRKRKYKNKKIGQKQKGNKIFVYSFMRTGYAGEQVKKSAAGCFYKIPNPKKA